MSYGALIAAWGSPTQLPAGVTGTLLNGLSQALKIAAVNGWTVAGPTQDVSGGAVLGYLALSGKLASLETYAGSPPTGSITGFPQAVMAAKQLITLLSYPSFTGFQTSNTTVYATVSNFLSLLAADAASGITSTDVAALLSLTATTIPWWQSVGLTSPISAGDLAAAGLT
jgi:hypothetical protein